VKPWVFNNHRAGCLAKGNCPRPPPQPCSLPILRVFDYARSIFIHPHLKAARGLQFSLVNTDGRAWPDAAKSSGRKGTGLAAFNLTLYNHISLFPYDKNGFLDGFKKTKSQPKQSEILCRVFSSTFQSKPTKSHSTEEQGEVHCAGLKPTVPSRLSLQLWNTSVWHRSCREELPLTGWDRRAEMTLWDLTTGEEQSFHTVCLSLFRAYQSHRLCHTKERFLLSTPES